MFEYQNDFLVVDELIFDPNLTSDFVIRIDDKYYMINNTYCLKRPIPEKAIRPYKRTPMNEWRRAKHNYQYFLYGLIPREGFDVEVGRPITAEELKNICEKFGLTADDISKEFEDIRGAIYGEQYAKKFQAIQIKVPGDQAIPLEAELIKKGIEAGNVAPGCVNINVGWGGYRKGAGRKPTGRRMARIYCTEKEEKKIREFLANLRKQS